MSDTPNNLLPCPFCGEQERLAWQDQFDGAVEFVECGRCDANGPTKAYGHDWNTRKALTPSMSDADAMERVHNAISLAVMKAQAEDCDTYTLVTAATRAALAALASTEGPTI